ncbi:hypothetical protein Y032_0021g312 [Ancylostoma ceylanicum]|uniref:Uncharacterized protein n=1 Tax=Ancylostoma ceylanicum TaxID=53326 RepID=A0A016V0U0_9BILA|nr:hypothetical protein Y032_0021g312 [Ancylostoma ceylanicum]
MTTHVVRRNYVLFELRAVKNDYTAAFIRKNHQPISLHSSTPYLVRSLVKLWSVCSGSAYRRTMSAVTTVVVSAKRLPGWTYIFFTLCKCFITVSDRTSLSGTVVIADKDPHGHSLS